MKKKFAVFCDGTWQSLRDGDPTNVVKLARCVAPVSAAGDPQLVYYDEGVGVGSEVSAVADSLTKYVGGAFGRGLDAKIEHAYQFLVLNYSPGDEIYIFGFSRGAYTARSLCGLIRKCGIIKRDCFGKIPEAMERYRNPVRPDSPEMIEFRRDYTHDLAAGDEDNAPLGISHADREAAAAAQPTLADLYQYRAAKTYRVMYAGIWDTVGELGVPRRFDVLGLDREYDFHDTAASSLIASIRHAVAANEQREVYDVTPFDNFLVLNRKWAIATGWNTWDGADPKFVAENWRPYQQHWFAGDHSSVGGGSKITGLSDDALLWIAQGAERAGLTLMRDPQSLLWEARERAVPTTSLGVHGAIAAPKGPFRHAGPATPNDVSAQAWQRYALDPTYRPANLAGVLALGEPRATAPAGFPKA